MSRRYYRRRYRRRRNSSNTDVSEIIKALFYIFLLPVMIVVLIIKACTENKKQKDNYIDNENKKQYLNCISSNEFNSLLKKQKTLNILFTINIIMLVFCFFCWITNIKTYPTESKIFLVLTIVFVITIIICDVYKNRINNILENSTTHEDIKKEILNNVVNEINEEKNNTTNNTQLDNTNIETNQSKYKLKTTTITANEQYFLDIIKKHFSSNYEIRPQVPLSSIIEKNKEHNWEYQNELNRIIDFGLFDKQTTAPLLLIEINDRTHHENKRIYRDQKVKEICEQAGIKLIAFWSEYSNTEQYIVERISKELNSD